jgi:hypothetical protein
MPNDDPTLFNLEAEKTDDRFPWQRSDTDPMSGPGQARKTDPDTSVTAAKMITAKATTARVRLLTAFFDARGTDGLTDEQAAKLGGVSLYSEYATRCSELRRAQLIEATGRTRPGSAGAAREVSRITPAGISVMHQRGVRP